MQPESSGGNFEYAAIPRQGLLFLSSLLAQWDGPFLYEREIWFEDRYGRLDPDKDLEGVDILMVTALVNEAPRAYEIGRLARKYHPTLVTIGGGPHMGPLSEESLREGCFDVIVNREGDDIIGQLCDVLLEYKRPAVYGYLARFPGISFMQDGGLVQTPRSGVVPPDLAELPDFRSIKGLTSTNPMAAGVMETSRGCTEKCTYCQVILQFPGYRMVRREVELKRLQQLRELASDGLIHTGQTGRFNVFVSDDLHVPPLRAVKFHNERLERLKAWKGRTEDMNLICQSRAEVSQDPELVQTMRDAGIRMIYVGVESNNAESLKAVGKRQSPSQAHTDLAHLKARGFDVVAMTIMGLPHDTEDSILEMADWVTQVSKYQTANWLTPLPGTPNWSGLKPLDEDGSLLPQGKLRPYHLYTGRQLVHHDDRWTMSDSRAIFEQYCSRLKPVDTLFERVFRLIERYRLSLSTARQVPTPVATRLSELGEGLSGIAEAASRGFTEGVPAQLRQISQSLQAVGDSAGREVSGYCSMHVRHASSSLSSLADAASKGLTRHVQERIRHMSRTLNALAALARTQTSMTR